MQEEVEEPCKGVFFVGGGEKCGGFLGLAPHAIAVVRDQIDGREVGQAEEQKFFGSNGAVGRCDC